MMQTWQMLSFWSPANKRPSCVLWTIAQHQLSRISCSYAVWQRGRRDNNSVSVDAGLGLQILQQLGGINTVMVCALDQSRPQQPSTPILSMDVVADKIAF